MQIITEAYIGLFSILILHLVIKLTQSACSKSTVTVSYNMSYLNMTLLNKLTLIIMSFFYINVGVKHFVDPGWFLFIIPPYLKFIGLELVYISGIFEILLGLLLLFPKYRKRSAYGIILLLIAVYPANIYLAFNEKPQELIDISSFAASWIRLPIQFILIGIAYYHSKVK